MDERSRTGKKESKSISSELASAINDGLYFYEQELKSKKSTHRKNNFNVKNKNGNSISISTAAGLSNIKPCESSGSSFEESSNPQFALLVRKRKICRHLGRSAFTGPIGKECADLWPRIASAANAIV